MKNFFKKDKSNYEHEWDDLENSGEYAEAEEYTGEEEYYEAEEYAGEEEYYEAEEYTGEEEYYEAEEYAGEEEYYEAEEDAVEEEYYEDEEYYEEEEYYEAAEDFYAENEADEEDDEFVGGGLFEKIRYFFSEMDMVDKVVAGTGIAVLLLALITGFVFVGNRVVAKQVNSFDTVGNQLAGISVIGGQGLTAVADAQIARQEAAEALAEKEKEDEETRYDEQEYDNEVTVALNMTSIKKDLKIKFVNKKTGKLIPNVPFEVEVTNPKGKVYTWTDDDKDGIIYKSDIAHGEYNIALLKLAGYEKYKFSTSSQPFEVKENIDYEKVNVDDEIKTEAEIDASKEDTAQNDVEQESSLKDTVEWVESAKIPIGESYVEVAKTTIDEPKLARFDNFVKLMGVNGETVTITGASTVAATGTIPLNATATGFKGDVTYTWAVSGAGATIEGSGNSVTLKANNTETTAQTATVSVTATSTYTETVSGDDITTTYSDTATMTVTVEAAAQTPDPVTEITLSKSSLELQVGETHTLTAKAGDVTSGFTWKSSDENVVKVESNGTVKALKEGNATVEVSYTLEDQTVVKAQCKVKVVKETLVEIAIKLDKTSEEIQAGKTLELVPTITGNPTVESKLVWSTSDKSIATVKGDTKKATVSLLKVGKVKITATYTEGEKSVEASCEINVVANPALDNATALKDKNGKQIYVENANGQYVAATYADYFKENQKFYLKQQNYKYTGWQTIDGKVYYFDANGNKVTGAQVIQGAQYNFDSNGVLLSSNGVLGIDVSKWNGSIDWEAVKNSGVSYVIIRCGYRGSSAGALIEDPKYRTNIQGATAAGLKVGVYFFTQAINEIEAVEEASMVLSLVKGYNISYPIFLDVESSGGRADGIDRATRTAVCKAFCQTIKNSGYAAGVYANKTWFESYIDTSQLGAYRIWLAQYAAKPTYGGRYDIWQYSSKGKVSGISGNVDMNLSYMGY